MLTSLIIFIVIFFLVMFVGVLAGMALDQKMKSIDPRTMPLLRLVSFRKKSANAP